ncbi:hypothetical protein Pmani_028938, partial [Petrolisthes manimaculis]
MCGICFVCGVDVCRSQLDKLIEPDWELLKNRGPDRIKKEYLRINEKIHGVMGGCVLWLQGSSPHTQPVTDRHGNMLLWNGDVLEGYQIPKEMSDSKYLSNQLSNIVKESDILSILSHIKGPWAFIFYHTHTRRLYFGRDALGRHSLLWRRPTHERALFALSSVCHRSQEGVEEVPACGVFRVDLSSVSSLTKEGFENHNESERCYQSESERSNGSQKQSESEKERSTGSESIHCIHSRIDRVSGRECWRQLQKLRPQRTWNFVQINVTREELQSWRVSIIQHLLQPHTSVLDDSIGCSLWFATRGKGRLNNTPYTSTVRVVLSGVGADEQLGGYSRHRGVFEAGEAGKAGGCGSGGGWSGLIREIDLEMSRIHHRNLGRDNRILAHHGRAP